MAESPLYVIFDLGATREEAESVQAAFESADVPAQVSDQPYAITASGEIPVVAPFVVLATTAASAFLMAFAGRAGQDGYDALKHLVGRLRAARVKDDGRIELIIRGDEGPDIIIGPDLPDGALARLLTEPLPPAPSGELVYDVADGRWRDSKEN